LSDSTIVFLHHAHSFGVLFIHCIARGLGISLLYNCPASCSGSLWQQYLLVLVAWQSIHVR